MTNRNLRFGKIKWSTTYDMPACKMRKCLPDDVLMFSLGCNVHCPLTKLMTMTAAAATTTTTTPTTPTPRTTPTPTTTTTTIVPTPTSLSLSLILLPLRAQDHFDRPSCAKYMRRCYYASPLGHVQGLLDRRRVVVGFGGVFFSALVLFWSPEIAR